MTHEAQAYKRIFAMLFMLRDDFAWICKSNKPDERFKGTHLYNAQKAYHKSVSDNFNAVNAMINRLMRVSDGETPRIIGREMTSERIKDLHVGLDTLLDIKNIEEIMTIIKSEMIPCNE